MFVLNIDFSGIDTSSIEDFNISMLEKTKIASERFLNRNEKFIKNIDDQITELRKQNKISSCLDFIFTIVEKSGKKLFVIIDEYDHFANDMIASGTYLGENIYKKTVWAGSQVRDFYETLKIGSKTVIDKIFITGINPIMLDDLTSGFNISNNLSNDVRYNEILGFTEDEVDFLIDECGIDRNKITVDRQFLYNGYMFHENAEKKLYNSAMMSYFLYKINTTEGEVKNLINDNLKTDYGRLRNLLKEPQNIESLEKIIELEKIPSEVIPRFSIETIREQKNFLSLLYYMGLVTIDLERGRPMLKIPNYSIKTMYWEYMEKMIMERNPAMMYDTSEIFEGLISMSFDGNYKPFFETFHKKFVSQISDNDLQNFSEKNVKFLLLSILFQNNLYLPISEQENSNGYTDIYLERRNLYKVLPIDWVWEIKYIKQKDSKKKNLIEEKKTEARTQLLRYKNSNRFENRTDIRYLAIVFVGKKNYFIEEISK
jgi:hypothetical protein